MTARLCYLKTLRPLETLSSLVRIVQILIVRSERDE